MRVLFLTDSLSDLDGVGRYAIRLITGLERLEPGLEVEVLLGRKHRPSSSAVPDHWRVSVGLPPDYLYYMSPARYTVSHAWGVWNASRAARRADVVHAIKDFPHNRIALAAANRANCPCIATAHGTYSVQPLHSDRHRAAALKTYEGLAAILCVSSYTRDRMEQALPVDSRARERLHVIPNAVDAEHYFAARELGERPWHGKRFTLGIGELKERKGHHLSLAGFCRIAPLFPGLHHFLVGKLSGDEYQAGLLDLVRAAGLEERVHLLGNVDEAEKIDLLQRAELFVHTPVTSSEGGFEGFGIVYLEAAAAGTPSLGSLDSGAQDAVAEGRSGRLVAQSVDAVADALRSLLADRDGLARLGEEARGFAAESSWEHNAQRVLDIYREALS